MLANVLLAVGLLSYLVGSIGYIKTLRDNPADAMGASIVFDGPWVVGSVAFAGALILRLSLHWALGLAIVPILVICGWLVKSFVLDKIEAKFRR